MYLSGQEQEVIQVYFGNSAKGALLVKKVDAGSGAPLSDVEFLVTKSDGSVVGDANGCRGRPWRSPSAAPAPSPGTSRP